METKDAQNSGSMRRPEKSEIGGETCLPPRFFTLGKVPTFRRSIHYHSKPVLMQLVEKTLTRDELRTLAKSPLGVFYKFHKLGFRWASRIVQYTLASQVVCDKPFEIWCVFGNHPSRFSLNEFEFLTGLNCSSTENLLEPRYDGETEKFEAFWSKLQTRTDRGPSAERLKLAFEACKSWESDDRLRLAFLCIYVTYIQGIDRREDSNLSLTKMVMDLTKFEGYPWGRVAFHYLIKSLKKGIVGFPWKSLKGFVQALQVWVYVALPEFGDKYGGKDRNVTEEAPPILSYLGAANRRYDGGKALLDNAGTVRSLLTPPGRDVRPEWEDDVEDNKIDIILSRIKEGVYVPGQEWSVEGVYDHILVLENGRQPPGTKVKKNNRREVIVRSHLTCQGQYLRTGVSIPEITPKEEEMLLSECLAAGGYEREAKRLLREPLLLANNPHFPTTNGENLNWYLEQVTELLKRELLKRECEGERFRDVSLEEAVHEMLTALNHWEARHRKFFEILREPRHWLGDEHIQAAMDMLRRRLSLRPSMFRTTRIDFIGPYQAAIISRLLAVCKSGKLEYDIKWKKVFDGEGTAPGYHLKRKWVEDVDQIYMVVHVQGSHWVAALIDLNVRTFTIWDPCFDLYSDEAIVEAAWPYAVCLPCMLALRDGKYRREPFEIKRVDKQFVPQNLQTGDCGVYSIKFIEDHARGNEFSLDLCDNNIKSIRDRLAVDIFYEVDVKDYPPATGKAYAGI